MKCIVFLILTALAASVLAQDNWEEDQKKAHLSRSYENKGDEFAASKQTDSAIIYYKKAFKLNGHWHHTSLKIGDLFREKQQLDSAIKYYTFSFTANPKFTDAVFRRGIVLAKKGHDSLALVDFDKTLQLNPMYDSLAYPYRAESKRILEQFEAAIPDFDKAIEFYPDDHMFWRGRGICHYNLGNLESALKDFTKALQLDPKDTVDFRNRAQVYVELNKLQLAIDDIKKYLIYNPNSAHAHFKIGAIYLDVRDLNKSLFHLNQAEKLNFSSHELYFIRGLNYYYLAKDAEAIANFEKTLSMRPDFAKAYYFMGVCKNDMKPKSGCEDFKRAIALGLKEVEPEFNQVCSQ